MTKTRFPRSVAKFVRRRKAEIRRSVREKEEQERQIQALIDQLTPKEK